MNASQASRQIFAAMLTLVFVVGFYSPVFSADCSQNRKTPKAPDNIYSKENPLQPTPENLSAGKNLYEKKAKPLACVKCHGENGDGLGKIAKGMTPNPRNFTCKDMMKDIPDGQLFWIIQNGSKGTTMMGYKGLKEEQIWQLIAYIRKFSS